jgi:tetratricopeptide (TPR) repeat protein
LGLAHFRNDDADKAIECYQKSLRLNPNFYKALLSEALAYEKKRDLEKAAECYTKALALTEDPKIKEVIMRQITRSASGGSNGSGR